MNKWLFPFVLLALGIDAAHGQNNSAPPQDLFGKSILLQQHKVRLVDLVEKKVQSHQDITIEFTFYVSTAGRMFNSQRQTVKDEKGTWVKKFENLETDAASGNTDQAHAFSTIQGFEFAPHHIVAFQKAGGGRARRISIDFNASYSSCTAIFENGTDVGKGKPNNVYFDWDGREVHILKEQNYPVTFRVTPGNALDG